MKRSIVDALGIDMPDDDEELYEMDDDDIETEQSVDDIQEAMKTVKDIKMELRNIPDITNKKQSLNELAGTAELKFQQIINIALNSDPRFTAPMLQAAAGILKIALDAHSKVIESDIKIIDLQMKRDKMEIDINGKVKPTNTTQTIEEKQVGPMDRNQLLAQRKPKKN